MAEGQRPQDRDGDALQWMHALEARQESTDDKVDDLAKSFDRFAVEVRQALGRVTSTDWRSLAAWAAVVVTVVALAGTGFIRDLIKVEKSLAEVRSREIADAETRGRRAAELEAVRRDLSTLDETLQREMRLLDDRGLQAVQSTDERLQRELGIVTEALRDRIGVLERGATPASSP